VPKLYTRTGDDGTTGLFGGGRVGKDHPRMEAIGTVDELNAAIGWVRNATTEAQRHGEEKGQGSDQAHQRGAMGKSDLPVVEREVEDPPRASEALAHGTRHSPGTGEGRCGDPIGTLQRSTNNELRTDFDSILATLQSRLFDIGADLATPIGSKHEDKVARISGGDVSEAEKWIDEVDGGNTPMTAFVLPGGTELSARLHLARTICRRAERRMIALARAEEGSAGVPPAADTKGVTPEAIIYINRISDLLFAMARRANREAGIADVAWEKKTPKL